MNRVRLKILTCALVALTFPASVWATNGYFTATVSVPRKKGSLAPASLIHRIRWPQPTTPPAWSGREPL